MKACVPLLLSLVFAVGCSDSSVTGPPPLWRVVPASTAAVTTPAAGITVMTRNLYIGADVDAVIVALLSTSSDDDLPALLVAVGTLQNTDFPTRVEALADEIAQARPHVVGLQEVEDLHIHLALPEGRIDIDQNFLSMLQAALDARELNYRLAGEVTNLTATLLPLGLDISLTDHDAILVDADRVDVGAVTARTFEPEHNIGTVVPGLIDLVRGFVAIDAIIGETSVKIASTHLEAGITGLPGMHELRAGEAGELVGVAGTGPAILLGDFNDTAGSLMYQVVTGAGFTDAWAALRPSGAPGLTCCELSDLSNLLPTLSGRIDYVFVRGIAGPNGKLLGQITVVGDRPGDRVPGPSYRIWPSDHAGVVASFVMPPAKGLAAR